MGQLIIRFVCPNQDNFHGTIEYTAYLLVPGWEIQVKVNDQKLDYSYRIVANPKSFILRDDPDEAWEASIVGAFPEADIIKYSFLCRECRAKGVKS